MCFFFSGSVWLSTETEGQNPTARFLREVHDEASSSRTDTGPRNALGIQYHEIGSGESSFQWADSKNHLKSAQ
jgi:hypothetical protein